jgi:hypothetical protein
MDMTHPMRKLRGSWATTLMLGALLVALAVAGSGNLATAAKPQPPPSPRFVDNGDGTVTDIQTALMWEQKTGTFDPPSPVFCETPTDCADPTNVNNLYRWSSITSNTAADGTLFTDFLPKMNCTVLQTFGRCGPGVYRDWRIPTIAELQTIANTGPCPPCIDPILGPTSPHPHWSSSSFAADPASAWLVNFGNGVTTALTKISPENARAVRGGP